MNRYCFNYPALVLDVVDAKTATLDVDLGWRRREKMRVQMLGAEWARGREREDLDRAVRALRAVLLTNAGAQSTPEWKPQGRMILLAPSFPDSFNRSFATFYAQTRLAEPLITWPTSVLYQTNTIVWLNVNAWMLWAAENGYDRAWVTETLAGCPLAERLNFSSTALV